MSDWPELVQINKGWDHYMPTYTVRSSAGSLHPLEDNLFGCSLFVQNELIIILLLINTWVFLWTSPRVQARYGIERVNWGKQFVYYNQRQDILDIFQ